MKDFALDISDIIISASGSTKVDKVGFNPISNGLKFKKPKLNFQVEIYGKIIPSFLRNR
jgi:hypothetical protein